jgi:hypothetical protein
MTNNRVRGTLPSFAFTWANSLFNSFETNSTRP